ncbi:MAG: phosphate ABC transporter permease subunit PstC [Actinomycetota bacterium]|nr:phosphate ABC transporter permease subunit PstC [Actinomycetota bacterium]
MASSLTDVARDMSTSRVALRAARPRYGELAIKGLLFLAAAASVLTTVGIVVALASPTVQFFRDVSFVEFFTTTQWSPLFANPRFGVLPLVTATLMITVIALAVAMPVGLMSAIYLSEYALPQVRKVVKPLLEILAGIPTVVYGFFALTFVTPNLLKPLWPFAELGVFNALSAGLVMGIMITPTISSLSEDALSAVPLSLRAGSFALGGNKLQTTVKVTIPAALSGIVAAIVLGISRAVGETMIVTIAAGGTPNLGFNPGEGMQTMTAFIAQAGIGDQATGTTGYLTIFAVGSTLFAITLLFNAISIRFARRFRETYE